MSDTLTELDEQLDTATTLAEPVAYATSEEDAAGIASEAISALDPNDPDAGLETEVLSDQLELRPSGDEAVGESSNGEVLVAIPDDASDGVTVSVEDGPPVVVTPLADALDGVAIAGEGAVNYDHVDGSSTTAVAKADGSVQFVTTIASAEAPTRYSYEVTVGGEPAVLLLEASGVVTVSGRDGSASGVVAPAWAFDATGDTVETDYAVDGSTLTQIVSHVGSDVAYPVVADPWLGIQLVSSFKWVKTSKGWRLDANPTPWARANNAATNGAWVTIGRAGWDEMKNRMNTTQKSHITYSMIHQWICHQGVASHDKQWNIEAWSKTANLGQAIQKLCQ